MGANMMYTAIAGLNTFNDALAVVSDNIANANTTGWKSNTVDFGDLVAGLMPTEGVNVTAQGVGSEILGITSDFSTGNEIQTGQWSNVMIQGNGFFSVQDGSGGGPGTGPIYYSRDGDFSVSSTGYLVNANGDYVLDNKGAPIQIPTVNKNDANAAITSYSISDTGVITGTDSNGTILTIDTLQVATFNNPNGLIRQGTNLYTVSATSGAATAGTAGTGLAGTIISGALENSNVDLTTQMVNLIDYQADYQANSKSIATGSTLLQTIVGLIPG
jgi:flagellar hook protein FlgE